ncbi:MAG: Fe-S cluster assembly ATPase SufC [Acidimicrobiia bacterium]
MNALEISGLVVRFGELTILDGVDLAVPFGELHVLMGPNGSGKSTLCHAAMGRPGYEAAGSVKVNGVEVLGKPVEDRARAGLFEGFQYPVEVAGVTLRELIAEMALVGGPEVGERALQAAVDLDLEPFIDRFVNVGLSGGEKKKSEIVQLLGLSPKAAILDEIDSGLDVDAVRDVAGAVQGMRGPELGVLVITHYARVLRYLDVDRVHVMMKGKIVRSGGRELADELDSVGYEGIRKELGLEAEQEESGDFLKGL